MENRDSKERKVKKKNYIAGKRGKVWKEERKNGRKKKTVKRRKKWREKVQRKVMRKL